MTWILGVRGKGEHRAQPVIHELLATDGAAISRARAEIDKHSSKPSPHTLRTVYRTGVRLGHIVKVVDASQGETWYGKIVGINHSTSGIVPYTDLDIERPYNG
ncbi:MAG: hypothetical protein GQ570_03980 [Helicobacteraceae bacterium]|nr:hypothetical protein [Helicobacteraceae bacterium]